MRYSIFFAIVLILVSGFVAYFGDILGRRMGKKRLTLFNLRPRYTAIVITTITGMIIALFTLATLVSINPEFKRMFAEGEQIIMRNKRLTVVNGNLESRNRELVDRGKFLENEVTKSQLQLMEARKQVTVARAEAVNAVKSRDLAVNARDAALKTVSRLENEIALRQTELAQLKKRSDAAENEVKIKTEQLDSVRQQLQSANSQLNAANSQLEAATVNLNVTNEKLFATTAKLNDATEKLAQAGKALEYQQQQLVEQHSALVKAGKANIELENEFIRQTSELRSSELILRQGEELARGVISSFKSEFGIRGDLISLLDEAGERAKAMGAKAGTNNRAVTLIFRQDLGNGQVAYTTDERQCIWMAKDAIAKSYREVLVQVVCARNTIAGEQAPVELRLYHNDLVFPAGRLVAVTKIDGRITEGRILLAVIDFLQKEVSGAALREGIVPMANSDPRATVGTDPASQVEGLMAVVDQVKAANARVRLEAYTSDIVYAAGPLNMDNMRFKVTKLE